MCAKDGGRTRMRFVEHAPNFLVDHFAKALGLISVRPYHGQERSSAACGRRRPVRGARSWRICNHATDDERCALNVVSRFSTHLAEYHAFHGHDY